MFNKGKYVTALHLMMLPAVIVLIIYSYIPMLGIVIAFQRFIPSLGFFRSEFVGFDNFVTLFTDPSFIKVLFNTVYISAMKIITILLFPLAISLLLNEIRVSAFKRTVQTIIYLPYFISWVLMSGIIVNILAPGSGLLNQLLTSLGFESVFFLGNDKLFPYIMVATNVWKECGWNTIVFLAALTNIDPNLYSAAAIDGANRWKRMRHVTIPGITITVVLIATLSLGNVLNAGFEQIFNLVSPLTLNSGDIIDTFVYRMGMQNAQFSMATAAGLFKSVTSSILIILSYRLAYKFTGFRII